MEALTPFFLGGIPLAYAPLFGGVTDDRMGSMDKDACQANQCSSKHIAFDVSWGRKKILGICSYTIIFALLKGNIARPQPPLLCPVLYLYVVIDVSQQDVTRVGLLIASRNKCGHLLKDDA